MDELERYRRRRAVRHQALKRLGVINIQCLCGETDPTCFDVEHVGRRKHNETVWGVCANCHRKKTAREQAENPTVSLHPGDPFERMGHALLGMAHYHGSTQEHLQGIAETMFKLAGKDIQTDED